MKYTDFKFKKDRIPFLKQKLATDRGWAIKGLLAVYDYQTAEEQSNGDVVENNGVGFSGVDGEILSSFSERVRAGFNLSEKQMAILFRAMPKYAKQLDGIAQDKLKAQREAESEPESAAA